MENLNTYADRLESALKSQGPFQTYNRDILHAAEIIVACFRHAERKVCLLSNKLDRNLYGDERLLDAIRLFLKKDGTEFHILVETEIDARHPIRMLADEGYAPKMTIRVVPPKLKEKYPFNFMTVDDFGYRFEYNREVYEAIASFHEEKGKKMVNSLKGIFSTIGEDAVGIGLGV